MASPRFPTHQFKVKHSGRKFPGWLNNMGLILAEGVSQYLSGSRVLEMGSPDLLLTYVSQY